MLQHPFHNCTSGMLAIARPCGAALAIFLLVANAWTQLRQIDPEKLPHDQRLQKAYSDVRSIESMARSWSATWAYPTPKEQVVSLLKSRLHNLESAQNAAPQNEELLLLIGLVAHLAYNVDVEHAYEVAVQSFEKANKLAPADYRAGWFLATLRCQSNEVKDGMEQMLALEDNTPWQQLPLDFWDDYINCSTIALMPAHTLRAIDHAVHLGNNPSSYSLALEIAHKRYKSADANVTYTAREAWQAAQRETDVQFASQLCGIGFSAHSDWRMDIKDVSKGVCISTVETGPYPGKSGRSSPTLLVLTRPAKSQETLGDFVQSFVKNYPSAHPIPPRSCPSKECFAFEILSDTMYQSEGGGHFLVVAFAGQDPEFPGLLFEKPEGPPKPQPGDKVTYYHPNEKLHRLPGTLYTIIELDSNASIFEKAAADFEYLLKSIQLN